MSVEVFGFRSTLGMKLSTIVRF